MRRNILLAMMIGLAWASPGPAFALQPEPQATTPAAGYAEKLTPEPVRMAQADANGTGQILTGQNRVDANAGTVTIMTTRNLGAPFMAAALDLSNLLDSGERFEDMRIIPVVARGKVQNLWDILYLKGVDMGFIQSDILEYLKDDPRIGSIKSRLRYITVMFPEEVHVIADKNINSLQDLAGKTVSINAKGTGSSVVGELLFRRLGIKATLIHEDTRRAIARIKSGEIAAHFNVLAKPTQVVRRIDGEGKLKLLPIPYTKEVQDVYLPSTLSHEDYPNLIPQGQTIPTIAAGNVLAAFNWAEDTERGRKVKRFVDAFFDRFDELKGQGYHPKWKEVNLAATLPGWTRLKAADDWLRSHPSGGSGAPTAEAARLKQDFQAFLADTNIAPGSEAQREALFQKFMQWRENQ